MSARHYKPDGSGRDAFIFLTERDIRGKQFLPKTQHREIQLKNQLAIKFDAKRRDRYSMNKPCKLNTIAPNHSSVNVLPRKMDKNIGIIPGYGGHIPHTYDTIGVSTCSQKFIQGLNKLQSKLDITKSDPETCMEAKKQFLRRYHDTTEYKANFCGEKDNDPVYEVQKACMATLQIPSLKRKQSVCDSFKKYLATYRSLRSDPARDRSMSSKDNTSKSSSNSLSALITSRTRTFEPRQYTIPVSNARIYQEDVAPHHISGYAGHVPRSSALTHVYSATTKPSTASW